MMVDWSRNERGKRTKQRLPLTQRLDSLAARTAVATVNRVGGAHAAHTLSCDLG